MTTTTQTTHRTNRQIERDRNEIAAARGSASTVALLDRLLAGDESVRDEVETMLDQIARDCASYGDL